MTDIPSFRRYLENEMVGFSKVARRGTPDKFYFMSLADRLQESPESSQVGDLLAKIVSGTSLVDVLPPDGRHRYIFRTNETTSLYETEADIKNDNDLARNWGGDITVCSGNSAYSTSFEVHGATYDGEGWNILIDSPGGPRIARRQETPDPIPFNEHVLDEISRLSRVITLSMSLQLLDIKTMGLFCTHFCR